MDILKIATAGSVDDGKSTLIGRLLYDTHSITQDKLQAIAEASKRRGIDYPDLSLLTDGLVAEREQGITIDVAHIYFSTPRRKFIIADTPGHFEYTRNMITGASTAQVAIILIDARHGIVEQTYRHYYITQLLRIPQVLVCVNKMDLVGYNQTRFDEIKAEFELLTEKNDSTAQTVAYLPIAAKFGDNIASRSASMPWFTGDPLVKYLEEVEYEQIENALPPRLPVQGVIRPRSAGHPDFRGFSGRIASGILRRGDRVIALPSGQRSTIDKIFHSTREVEAATAGQSIVLTLTDEIDISRGGLIVSEAQPVAGAKEIGAKICWLSHEPLLSGGNYLLQHGSQRVKAKAAAVRSRVNVASQAAESGVNELKLNEIGQVTIRTAEPVFAESYHANKNNGAFILIHEGSNSTVGVGFVE